MTRRRLVITIALLLIGGVVINVGVAWGIGLVPLHPRLAGTGFRIVDGDDHVSVTIETRSGVTYVTLFSAKDGSFETTPLNPPRWALPKDLSLMPRLKRYSLSESATGTESLGLPLRSMMTGGKAIEDPTARDGFRLKYTTPVMSTPWRDFPLSPIWPGFLANTAIYSAILALPIFGIPALHGIADAWRS